MMLAIYQGILTLAVACSHSQWSCLLLWLVKRNQVRLPERFGPLQPATAGLAMPSIGGTEETRLWLKLHTNASLQKTTLLLSYTLMFPGREKRGALGSKVSNIFTLDTQSSVALHPQLDPLTCSWHTESVKILRREFLPALVQPG